MSEARGTGKTTKQIEDCPAKATFVWCNDCLDYPLALARKLNRKDVRIVGLSTLNGGAITLRGLKNVIFDHACCAQFTKYQHATYRKLLVGKP